MKWLFIILFIIACMFHIASRADVPERKTYRNIAYIVLIVPYIVLFLISILANILGH